jgi:thioredoxin reductase (NADPH)
MQAELLIAGAGPAGVSAALWARSLDLSVLLIEVAEKIGGQLHNVHFHPSQLPGITAGEGPDIALAYGEQLRSAGIAVEHGLAAEAFATDAPSGNPRIRVTGGEQIETRAFLIATGVRRRRLEVPGERELEGCGVSHSARLDGVRLAGKQVVVVGGGDGAFENALLLNELGCRVTIAIRGAPRARREFRDRVATAPIEMLEFTRVAAFVGGSRLTAVRLERDGKVFERPAAGAVIKIGVVPNTEWCRETLAHDSEGFLVVNQQYRASRPRVWAAGDVTRPTLFGIAVAIGGAALAVADIRSVLRAK